MADFKFPASDLDSASSLLDSVGGFWSTIYQGNFLVECLLYARGRLEQQCHEDILELANCLSRAKVPVFHTDSWYNLVINESDRNQANADYAIFDGTYLLDGTLTFDEPLTTAFHVWQLPPGLADVLMITNRINTPSVARINGIDFFLKDGAIWFRKNPFDDPLQAVDQIFSDGTPVDRTCSLWLYRSQWDKDHVYLQYGYVIAEKLPSSPQYKQLVKANLDGIALGITNDSLFSAFSAVCDVPLANGNETVERVFDDLHARWVVTDKFAYPFKQGSNVIVSSGQALNRGDPMTDALQFFEFGRGQVPEQLRALALGRGFLAEGYFQELVFENKVVPLEVDEDQTYTEVRFEIGGWPGDVDLFWTEVHDNGVAANQTLAMLLDQRPEGHRDTQPTALALPATVNPLGFLLNNLFRNNLFVVLVKSAWFGPQALGLQHCRFLRRLVPPHSACIVVAELGYKESIPMSGPGDTTTPGYEEKMNLFVCVNEKDAITTDMVTERVRLYQVGGRCQ